MNDPEPNWLDEAQALWNEREYSRALDAFLRGQHYADDSLGLITNVAELLMTLRRGREAMAILEAARRLDPYYQPVHENLLTAGLNLKDQSGHPTARRHFRWGRLFDTKAAAPLGKKPARLRVGYLSVNFGFNPEMFFALPLLKAHNRSRFEVFCYSAGAGDRWTARIRKFADHWRDIATLSDEQAARRIQKDAIHILVDLSGHYAGGRLPVLARRPAPIQVSFPTYPATTGLKTVQYRITDRWVDPPGETESLHTEKLIRLDRCYCCYSPPQDAPEVGPLPALRNGYITFGVLNRPQKIIDSMLRVWGRILSRTPGSRILFHHVYNGPRPVQPEFRDPLLRVLGEEHVSADRVEFVGMRSPVGAHLAVFHQVDIALDTFPYHGMTTTCESLWMGVPVVTLAGRSHVARVGVSLNASVGLDRFSAKSERQYVRIAQDAARDPRALEVLRCSLRDRLRRSPLLDAVGYARAIEREYVAMWKYSEADGS